MASRSRSSTRTNRRRDDLSAKMGAGCNLAHAQAPGVEQTFVIEGSFYDHDGICRAGEFVWRRVGSFHETHSDEGAVILAVYRKPNVFQHSTGIPTIVSPDSRRNFRWHFTS